MAFQLGFWGNFPGWDFHHPANVAPFHDQVKTSERQSKTCKKRGENPEDADGCPHLEVRSMVSKKGDNLCLWLYGAYWGYTPLADLIVTSWAIQVRFFLRDGLGGRCLIFLGGWFFGVFVLACEGEQIGDDNNFQFQPTDSSFAGRFIHGYD